MSTGTYPKAVSREEWLVARKDLLAKEKALTRQYDEVSAARRELPWVRVEKDYIFDTLQGKQSLGELFAGRSQLIVYHFMWRHELGNGCTGCSFLADHIDGANLHLSHHDVTLLAVSRAPLASIDAYRRRMGWNFTWASSYENDFNFDYHVSFTPEEISKGKGYYNYGEIDLTINELPGVSIFYRTEQGEIFHTYSAYERGVEPVVGAYMFLDLTPKGRNENGPHFSLADWVRPHDQYAAGGSVDASGGYIAPEHECNCERAAS